MGIRGFYGYSLRNIPKCSKEINIIDEIQVCNDDKPKIMINLQTLSYHFKVKKKDLLCGYQLNKIKYVIENFFQKMINAGAELIFVFYKPNPDDSDFLKRRKDDYRNAQELIENIRKHQNFQTLMSIPKLCSNIPFNIMITLCMIQSAEKFGKVHGISDANYSGAMAVANLATELRCNWILGLSTFKFFIPGNWKIWSDAKLNIVDMKVLEINKEAIMEYFQLKQHHAPLFIALTGELKSSHEIKEKVSSFFDSRSKFLTVASFVHDLKYPLTEETYKDIAVKIFGEKYDPIFLVDLKKTLEIFSIHSPIPHYHISNDILKLIKNDFVSYAEQILLNKIDIFTSPVFMDLSAPDMENWNSLILPWIQKTAGILLKNDLRTDARNIYILESHDEDFKKIPLEIIYPEFDVPPLKTLLNSELSTFDKMKYLFWLMDYELSDIEIPSIPEEYIVDCMILIFLVKKNSLTIMDARCILKTLVDARTQKISLQYETDYPKKVNSRALRCTFLYCKMYFILHSCLACFGMKNFCPELKFDGVYFQKMYSLNVLDEPEEDEDDKQLTIENLATVVNDSKKQDVEKTEEVIIPNDKNCDQTELVDLFANIIRF